MKKLIVTIVALSLFVGVSGIFAQTATTGIIGKGVKVGLNMAKFTGDDAPDDSKMNLGFVAGGYITYAFSDLFAIQPEIQFNMKGNKVEVGDATYKGKLSYIEIPVLAKVMLSGGEKIKPSFYVGPEFAFLMSASASADPEPEGFESDIKDDFKSSDFGLIGGIGLDYLMGTHKITFDLRYDVGLASIADYKNLEGDDAKVKNSAITFLVGYGF
jgi:hypothetical protein